MRSPTASAHVLAGFAGLVQPAGVDAGRLLRAARIPRSALTDPEALIPLDRLAHLLDLTAAATGWADLALRLARTRRLSDFGQIGLLARDEPDVGHALLAIISHMHLRSDNIVLQLEPRKSEVAVTARLVVWPASSSNQVSDLMLGGLFQILRHLLGDSWRPLRVTMTHGAPTEPRSYRQYFGAPVAFDQDIDAIVLSTQDVQREIPQADPMFRSSAQRQLEQWAESQSSGLQSQVCELIKILLPTGRCSIERVALRLGVQSRTLQRRLGARGSSFSKLLSDTRRELAEHYVLRSGRPMSQIAQLLGFSETSAFSRWCAAEFACSATELREGWRAQHP